MYDKSLAADCVKLDRATTGYAPKRIKIKLSKEFLFLLHETSITYLFIVVLPQILMLAIKTICLCVEKKIMLLRFSFGTPAESIYTVSAHEESAQRYADIWTHYGRISIGDLWLSRLSDNAPNALFAPREIMRIWKGRLFLFGTHKLVLAHIVAVVRPAKQSASRVYVIASTTAEKCNLECHQTMT